MENKIKNVVVVIEFFAILLIVLLLNIIHKDEMVSLSERRKLAQFPKINVNSIFNGKVSKDFEKYTSDQFISRDTFRKIKYVFSTNILKQQDDNKMFVNNGSIYKMEYPLNVIAIDKASKKMQDIYEKHLQGMNVFYSVIPDKNYYLDDNHLKMDYTNLEKIMASNLKDMKYIDIKDTMDVGCFYKTDLHWKQERILNVANYIKEEMGVSLHRDSYDIREAGKFYGVYYGQVGIEIEPDKIKYVTNDVLENCVTYNYETSKTRKGI